MSDNSHRGHHQALALHKLRSTLARAQAEAELLELLDVPVKPLMEALQLAIGDLAELEGSAVNERIADQRSVAGQTVVVIDDDFRLAELTAGRLNRRGIRAFAGSSLDMLTAISSNAVAVVDLGTILGATKDQLAQLRACRFLAVSGLTSPDARSSAADYGAQGFFTKPIDINAIIGALSRFSEEQG